MNRDSSVYVAGHSGLVGSAIIRRLRNAGYSRLLTRSKADLDLTRQQAVEDFFERERPECVFLAAAKVGGILANNTYKADFIHENLAIALNVISASHKYGVQKLLNLGSSCIYPKLAPQPLNEDHLLQGPLEPTNEPYAIAKIAAIKLCRYFNEQYGTNFLSVMPTNLYGPYDNFNLETAHVLPALIRKFHLARLVRQHAFAEIEKDVRSIPLGFETGTSRAVFDRVDILRRLEKVGVTGDAVVLWGTGSPYREFLHVDDLADAVVFIMERFDAKEIGELVNIGTGTDQTITGIAQTVKEVVGFEGATTYDSSKPDGTPRKLLDVTRLERLGWKSSITLRDGIASTYRWYQEPRA